MRIIDADSIDYDDYWYNKGFSAIECQKAQQLINEQPTVQAIIIPDNATNGDMIRAIFPMVEVKEKNNGYEVYFGVGTATQFLNHQWWNAPYKRGDKA